MSSTTVAEFANELKKSTETLLDQLKSAGVSKTSATDVLTDADKHSLLNFLQSSHGTTGAERKKITLVKKQTTEIKQADATGKARTIQVEVRKKRTFVRREDGSDASADSIEPSVVDMPAASVIDDAELLRREEEARKQAEFLRRQEEELTARRQERESQEASARAAAEKAAAKAQEVLVKSAAKKTKAKTPEELEAQAAAEALAIEAAKRALEEVKAAAEVASQAAAKEETARAVDLGTRRRKAEDEAAAIRSMMSTPNKGVTAKKPEVAKPVVDPKAAIKGTLHKPAAGSTVAKAKPGATGAAGAPGTGKEVKSSKLS